MSSLMKLKDILTNNDSTKVFIPDLWNCLNLECEEDKFGELAVDESKFLLEVIESFYDDDNDYTKSYSKIYNINTNGDWVKESVAYSMMIRTSTTWDMNVDGVIDDSETGTFLRTIILLPLLKKMGVNMLYLLPISKYSSKDKKGELGSAYGVSNFTELDPNLKDNITSDLMTIEEEFQALVEACHMFDIRVVIDIIPRTNSVNSDLIAENPEWFYWIDYSDLDGYTPPVVEGIKPSTQPNNKNLSKVYASKEVLNHISKFRQNPKETCPDKWDKVVNEWKNNQNEFLLDVIRREFGLTIAPAFSDHINDPQPAWSDITFFRLYMDHPKESMKHLTKDYNPYILFDTIKGNLFQGEIVNQELWDRLAGIIPYYQQFGVDGARIDMGHALPKDLTSLIVSSAKEVDSDFAFIAEEMNVDNAMKAKENGYNMIIGNGFWMAPRLVEGKTKDFYYNSKDLILPVFAAGETHDTQRLAARDNGGVRLSKMLTILNMFMPNGVPFINSGQELYERQPMNLGIDCKPDEDENLPLNDPFNKKLALFDKYQFHYLVPNRWELVEILEEVSKIRNRYLHSILDTENFTPIEEEKIIGMVFNVDKGKLIVVANADMMTTKTIDLGYNYELLFSSHRHSDNTFSPGEVKIYLYPVG
ncbi:alpha-amylase family glycosyl hydrolase [Mycoplasmatota bacterium WC44]